MFLRLFTFVNKALATVWTLLCLVQWCYWCRRGSCSDRALRCTVQVVQYLCALFVKPERVHVRLGGAALHQEQCRGAGAASASGGAHGQRREEGLTEAHAEGAGRSRRDAHAARGVHRTLLQGPRAPAASPSSPYAPPESAFLPPRLLFLRVSRRILYILVRRSVYDVLVYSTLWYSYFVCSECTRGDSSVLRWKVCLPWRQHVLRARERRLRLLPTAQRRVLQRQGALLVCLFLCLLDCSLFIKCLFCLIMCTVLDCDHWSLCMQSGRHRVRRGAPALPPLALALAPYGERERAQCESGALEGEGGARRAEGDAEAAGRERVEPGVSRWTLRLPGLPDLLSDDEWRVRLLPIQLGRVLRRLRHLLYATVVCAKCFMIKCKLYYTYLCIVACSNLLDKIRKIYRVY